MNKVYRVVFTGLHQTEEYFKSRISMLGVSPEETDKILKKAPVILKEAESLEYIKRYAGAIIVAGGNVDIQYFNTETGTENKTEGIPGMSSFTQCPRCGHRQHKKKSCVRCGFNLTHPVKG